MKKYLSFILGIIMIIMCLTSCGPKIDEATQSLIDELPVTDAGKLPYNVEELMKRADNTGALTKYTIGYSYDNSVENKVLIFSNDGDNNYKTQEIINTVSTNSETGKAELTFKSRTESYYSYQTKTLYTQDSADNTLYNGVLDETAMAPADLSIKAYLNKEIGDGFWDAFLQSFVTAKYDALNDSYILNDFSIVVNDETKAFNNVVVKYSGMHLKSFESTTGPQIVYIEFNNLSQTTVVLPNNRTEATESK